MKNSSSIKFPCVNCIVLVRCKMKYRRSYNLRKVSQLEEKVCKTDSRFVRTMHCSILHDYFKRKKLYIHTLNFHDFMMRKSDE